MAWRCAFGPLELLLLEEPEASAGSTAGGDFAGSFALPPSVFDEAAAAGDEGGGVEEGVNSIAATRKGK